MNSSLDDLYKNLGKITYSFSRLEFNISQFLYQMGLESDPYSFFRETGTSRKFDSISKKITKVHSDKVILNDLKQWLEKFKIKNHERNELIHSLILQQVGENEVTSNISYRIFDPQKINLSDPYRKYSRTLSFEELEEIANSFVQFHNEGYLLFDKLVSSIPQVNVTKIQKPNEGLTEIQSWLRSEQENNNEGFYLLEKVIISRFKTLKAFLAFEYLEIVGFAIYSIFEQVATIEMFEVKPNKRQQGFGKVFARKLIHKFRQQHCKAIVLQSINKDSTAFWGKLDFKDITNLPFRNPGFTHYLPIIDLLDKKVFRNEFVIVEIWNDKPTSNTQSQLIYKHDYSNNSSSIVYAVEPEWVIKVFLYNIEVYSNLIKSLNQSCKVLFGYILVITDISMVLKHIKRIT